MAKHSTLALSAMCRESAMRRLTATVGFSTRCLSSRRRACAVGLTAVRFNAAGGGSRALLGSCSVLHCSASTVLRFLAKIPPSSSSSSCSCCSSPSSTSTAAALPVFSPKQHRHAARRAARRSRRAARTKREFPDEQTYIFWTSMKIRCTFCAASLFSDAGSGWCAKGNRY